MSNFKSQAKRKRELAKLDKRQAKDQKRALRRAERSEAGVGDAAPVVVQDAGPVLATDSRTAGAPRVRKPLTLAEAVERWKRMKVTNPRKR